MATALQLAGPAGAAGTASGTAQAGRFASLAGVYEGLARNPGVATPIIDSFLELAGPIGASGCDGSEAQAARFASLAVLYDGMARNPGAETLLIATALQLAGPAGAAGATTGAAQAARFASFAKAENAKNPFPLRLVDVEINGVPGLMVYDSGAQLTTIESELVDAIGLHRETEAVTASGIGGHRITGRRITVPSISALGRVRYDIQACDIPAGIFGVDGLLGQSYIRSR